MEISFIDTDRLLRLVEEHGVVGKSKRTWTFVHGADGSVSLLPTHGVRYLYRGQTKRYSPCLPAISRAVKTHSNRLSSLFGSERVSVLANLIRSDWYCAELGKHPLFRW